MRTSSRTERPPSWSTRRSCCPRSSRDRCCPSGAAAAGPSPGSSAATSAASARPQSCFSPGFRRCSRSRSAGDIAGAWIESAIRHLGSESESSRPGRRALLAEARRGAVHRDAAATTWRSCAARTPAGSPRRATRPSASAGVDASRAHTRLDRGRAGQARGRLAHGLRAPLRRGARSDAARVPRALAAAAGQRPGCNRATTHARDRARRSATSPRRRSTALSSESSGYRRRGIESANALGEQ